MKPLTEIAFLLDRSGSMQSIRQAAIDGFNEFLRDQQTTPGNTRLTLVLFDDEFAIVHDSLPIAEILPLDLETFVPRGTTALLDAVGDTIDRLGKRFAAAADNQKPNHVAIAILTDGEENASHRFTWQDIAKRIFHQTQKYQWDFLFLGAGPDAIATAAKINIQAHHSAQYTADAIGQQAASKGISRKIKASRLHKLNPDDLPADLHISVDAIVREEDQQRRGL